MMFVYLSLLSCQRNWQTWQANSIKNELLLDDAYASNALYATALFNQTSAGRLLLSTTENQHYLSPIFAKEMLNLQLQYQRNEILYRVEKLRFDQFELEDVLFLSTDDHLSMNSKQALDKLEPQIIGILSLQRLIDQGIDLEIRLDEGLVLFKDRSKSMKDQANIPINAIELGDRLSQIKGKWIWEEYEKENENENQQDATQTFQDHKAIKKLKKREINTNFQISSAHASNRWPMEISSNVVSAQIIFLDEQNQPFELSRLHFTKRQSQNTNQSEIGLYHFWGGRLYINQSSVFFWKDAQVDLLKSLNRFKPHFQCDEKCRSQSQGYVSAILQKEKSLKDELILEIPNRHRLSKGLWLKYQINTIGLPIHLYVAYDTQISDQPMFQSVFKTEFAQTLTDNQKYPIQLVDIVRLNRECLKGFCFILNTYD